MATSFTRILSDLHFGDRASTVRQLDSLAPLFDGPSALVFNGDTLDTRPGPHPAHTARCRQELTTFLQRTALPVTLLTGNHDPDISSQHTASLCDGRVLVFHGDILLDDLVPWGRDARTIRRMIAQALRNEGVPTLAALTDAQRVRIWREVSRALPQRHQSEQNAIRYALHFLADTVWPPNRFFEIFRAWRHEAARAGAFARRVQPEARVVLLGHTHRPSIRRLPDGLVVVNTGSYTTPFGGFVADVSAVDVVVRRVRRQRGVYAPADTVATIPLAPPP